MNIEGDNTFTDTKYNSSIDSWCKPSERVSFFVCSLRIRGENYNFFMLLNKISRGNLITILKISENYFWSAEKSVKMHYSNCFSTEGLLITPTAFICANDLNLMCLWCFPLSTARFSIIVSPCSYIRITIFLAIYFPAFSLKK